MRAWIAFSHWPKDFALPFTVDVQVECIDGIPEQLTLEKMEFKDRSITITLDAPQIVEVMGEISKRLKIGNYLVLPHYVVS